MFLTLSLTASADSPTLSFMERNIGHRNGSDRTLQLIRSIFEFPSSDLEAYRMARPMARPAVSAPMIIGTGFSRRNNLVRSRAVVDLLRICSRRRGRGSKTLGAGRRRRRGGPFFSEAASGSSFTKSSSIGCILHWFAIPAPGALISQFITSRKVFLRKHLVVCKRPRSLPLPGRIFGLPSRREPIDRPTTVFLARVTEAIVQPIRSSLPKFHPVGFETIATPMRRQGNWTFGETLLHLLQTSV